MNDFRSRLEQIYRKPWHPVVGGGLLGLVSVFLFWYNKKPWGVSKTLARWGTWLGDSLGLQLGEWEYWQMENLNSFWTDPETWTNLGIIAGAFFAATLAKEFKLKKITSLKKILIALIGGWLMGYGARIAPGCNIGGFMNTVASLSVSGWIHGLGTLVGVYIGTKILVKWLI